MSQTLKVSKNVLSMLEFPINFFWGLRKPLTKSSDPWNIGSTLYNAKFNWQIPNHFSAKARQTSKLPKNSPHIGVSCKLVLKSAKILSLIFWPIEYLFKGFKMSSLIRQDKTIFLKNRNKPWNFPKTCFLYWSFL